MAKTTDEVWQKLSTEHLGFYTSRNSSSIPHKPGVYAWFFPLRHHRIAKIVDFLEEVRKVSAYDTRSSGIGRWDSSEQLSGGVGFNWDPLNVTISRDVKIGESDAIEDAWKSIQDASTEVQRSFGFALTSSTLFSRPLYVGLTRDLQHRYLQHTRTGSRFKERFDNYMNDIGTRLTVDRLLFVCIPIDAGSDVQNELTDKRIQALEYILKIACQPAFSDR